MKINKSKIDVDCNLNAFMRIINSYLVPQFKNSSTHTHTHAHAHAHTQKHTHTHTHTHKNNNIIVVMQDSVSVSPVKSEYVNIIWVSNY